MTTGRINQVAFLGDTTTRTIPDADETRGDETGEEVVLIGHERLEMGGRRGGGPRAGIAFCIRKHERSRAGQFGGSPLDWNTGATARLAPRPRGGARRGEGQLHIRVPPKWVRSTGTPPRRKGPQGPQALRPQRPSAQRGRARARVWSLRGAGLSSAKDSTRRSVGIVLQGGPRGSFTARAWPTARASGAKRPLLQVGNRTAGARVASSPDSDLEAFSHNPTHGSFAPLAFQPSAMTNCANQRFLSY
ncbi:hypothetical protein Peur_004522 [Populus x canadensis]